MSGIEQKLQDYLDGRLDDAGRLEVEARIAADPELARRMKTLRELGGHLREEQIELPPGFYTRLRARYEEGALPRRGGWARLISWEAAGLTAAVGLALVLFLPGWLLDDLPQVQGTAAISTPAPDAQPSKKKAPAGVAKEGVVVEEVAPATEEPAGPPVMSELAEGLADDAKSEQQVGDKGAYRQAPERSDVVADEATAVGERKRSQQSAAALPTQPAEQIPRSEAEKSDEILRDDTDAVDALGKPSKDAPRAQHAPLDVSTAGRPELAAGSLERPEPFRVAELPAGTVPTGAVRIHESVDDWRSSRLEQRRSTVREADAFAGADTETTQLRVVLLGPRDEPFPCSGIRVETTGDAYRVRIERPDGQASSPEGCALFLPADGRRIDVVTDGAAR